MLTVYAPRGPQVSSGVSRDGCGVRRGSVASEPKSTTSRCWINPNNTKPAGPVGAHPVQLRSTHPASSRVAATHSHGLKHDGRHSIQPVGQDLSARSQLPWVAPVSFFRSTNHSTDSTLQFDSCHSWISCRVDTRHLNVATSCFLQFVSTTPCHPQK